MDPETLVVVVLLVLALPLLGSVLAMACGVTVALARRSPAAGPLLARLEPPLRGAARAFGCSVDGVRSGPDRRVAERRGRSRRPQPPPDRDRRRRERRGTERRRMHRQARRD